MFRVTQPDLTQTDLIRIGTYKNTHFELLSNSPEDKEDVKNIYVHSLRELDLVKVFEIKKMARLEQIEYLHMIKAERRNINQVKSKHKII